MNYYINKRYIYMYNNEINLCKFYVKNEIDQSHILSCALPCHAVPCRAVPYRTVPCRTVPCYVMPCKTDCVIVYQIMPYYAIYLISLIIRYWNRYTLCNWRIEWIHSLCLKYGIDSYNHFFYSRIYLNISPLPVYFHILNKLTTYPKTQCSLLFGYFR